MNVKVSKGICGYKLLCSVMEMKTVLLIKGSSSK